MSFIFPTYIPKEQKEKADKVQKAIENSELKLCECGCLRYAKKGNRYLKAHQYFKQLAARIRKMDEIYRNRRFQAFEIKAARLDYGYSQATLAKKIGVTRRLVSYWERGERTPYPHREKQMIEILPMLRNKYK